MSRAFLWLGVALWLVVPPARLVAQERPARAELTPELLKAAQRTDWYGVYLKDKKIGYCRSSLARVRVGKDWVYRATQVFKVSALSAGEKLETEQIQEEEFDGQPPYAFRQARSVDREPGAEQETVLSRTAKGLRITTTNKGEKTMTDRPGFDYTLGNSLAVFAWLRGRPPVGAMLLSQDLDPNEMRLETEQRKILASKTALVKGVKLTYHEVEALLVRHKVKTLERYDEQGNLISGHIGALEMRLETPEQARNIGAATDLFVLGLAKIDRPLGDPRTMTRLVIEVRGKDAGQLSSGPSQTVSRDAAGKVLCKLGREFGRAELATAEDIKESLQATVTYPAANARIQKLARRAVGDAPTDREKVTRLVRFVHDYIRPSYRGKGTIVLDLLDKREGDCTAYAALLTTLARAAGVPCREVSGLLYIGDDQKGFGGHAWNEVVLDGKWVPVDASCNETQIDPTHICFGSDVGGGLNLARSFGGLSLRLVEVRHDPKKR